MSNPAARAIVLEAFRRGERSPPSGAAKLLDYPESAPLLQDYCLRRRIIGLTVRIVSHMSNLSGLEKVQKVLFGEHALQHILRFFNLWLSLKNSNVDSYNSVHHNWSCELPRIEPTRKMRLHPNCLKTLWAWLGQAKHQKTSCPKAPLPFVPGRPALEMHPETFASRCDPGQGKIRDTSSSSTLHDLNAETPLDSNHPS